MTNKEFLEKFFDEKELHFCEFAKKDHGGTTHFISLDSVIEYIKTLPEGSREQNMVVMTLRKIDYANGDVMHFMEHCAQAMAYAYEVH